MPTKLENLTSKLQSALDAANALPDALTLDELSNPGSAATMLAGTEMLDAEGKKVTGNIASKSSSNLTASGATVTVPAGYYPSQATKSVATATRAETTITTTANDTADTLTFTASNNQGTGYVTGSNKTATKTVTLTASGATVTASDGSKSVSKSVATATQATPTINVNTSTGQITASATQTAGYVSAGTKSATPVNLTTKAAATITPTKSSQTAVAKNVYTTGVVTVGAIPSQYQDVSGVTATAAGTLSGQKFVNTSGTLTTGTMPNNGSMSKTIDGLNTKSATIPAGYTSGGTVSLDSTIDNTANAQAAKIAEIAALLEGKSVGAGGSGSTELNTATLTITGSSNKVYQCNFFSPNGLENKSYKLGSYTCYVPGFVMFAGGAEIGGYSGDIELLSKGTGTSPLYYFRITGNATIQSPSDNTSSEPA